MYQPLLPRCSPAGVIDCCHSRDSAASRQHDARRPVSGQSQFAGYYCYRGEPVVRLAGEAPFATPVTPVVNGEQAAAQLIIFREARQGRLRHGGDVQHIKVFAAEHHAGHFFTGISMMRSTLPSGV